MSITQIAKITSKGRNNIYKVLKEELNYVPYNRLVKAKSNQRRKKWRKIADYFSNTFDYTSVFIDCKNSTQNCTLVKKERSLSKAEFRVNSQKYWYGTSLSFSGNQFTYFYKTIKEKELDWEILNFDNRNLSWIDLYYDRKFKKVEKLTANLLVKAKSIRYTEIT